jgi:YD repeat-containing protein
MTARASCWTTSSSNPQSNCVSAWSARRWNRSSSLSPPLSRRARLAPSVCRTKPDVFAPIDANGNLTSDGTKTSYWNALNQLVEVKQSTTTIATFDYDGAGRRIEKAAAGLIHTSVYDAEDIVEERITGPSSETIRYYHGNGISEPLGRKNSSDVVTYYLVDHLGSIVQETNNAASVHYFAEVTVNGAKTIIEAGPGQNGNVYFSENPPTEGQLVWSEVPTQCSKVDCLKAAAGDTGRKYVPLKNDSGDNLNELLKRCGYPGIRRRF